MSLFNYIETPNTNLICCICRAPFTDPTTTQTCAHTFCYECILRALSHSSICPVDRSHLLLADLRPANPIVRSLVDELQVECVHRQEGCLHTCQRQLMSLHLRDECEYGEAQCPISGCEELLRRREVTGHIEEMHGEEKNLAEATNGGEEEEPNEEEVHICPHAALGCLYTGPQKTSDHLSSCPYESLKEFFTFNTAKISLLTEQNMLLRHRVDTLEATVQTLRKETNAARHALGPWYRTSYQVGGGPGLGPIVDSGVGIISSDSQLEMQHHAAGPSSAGEDPLAPYFPPAENVLQRPTMGRRASSSMVGDTAYSRTGLMGVVAPLDLGATLEGTLVGLRESMKGLAVGIDSVGRRNEIGLTNETLRLGEEMMSIRAQMHGLRMQMHGMMMDRNTALRSEEGQYFQPPILPAPNRNNMNLGVPPSITKL